MKIYKNTDLRADKTFEAIRQFAGFWNDESKEYKNAIVYHLENNKPTDEMIKMLNVLKGNTEEELIYSSPNFNFKIQVKKWEINIV
ncbi:hypothetical protein IAQ67_16250 [Paenibacillus peoriae]|uniref:Uncharacterized protein n=1 Tax=Paenibacillus peoriae TaxID=59893 RepID=A0A7H0Y2Y7_9BACL|nr:hypothetical protein [Paenibacillus peoriae]QNR65445.1 hypothetical protein IAQ67_16250 [Paenibacillus peoriae]